MHEAILYPSKCLRQSSWIKKYKDGDRYEVSNDQFNYHQSHGCIVSLKKYKMVTTSKTKCVHCGKITIKQEKKIIK